MPFKELANNILKVDPFTIFIEFAKQKSINDNVVNEIQKRLFQKGITGDGRELKTDSSGTGEVYSPITIILKEKDNSPSNRVTLKDTGEFYDSLVTIVNKIYLEVDGDFQKDDGHMQENFTGMYGSDELFEESVLSLSDREIADIIINEYIIFYKNRFNEIFTTK